MYLIAVINSYQARYETETSNPELHGLLNIIKEFIVEQEMQNRRHIKHEKKNNNVNVDFSA